MPDDRRERFRADRQAVRAQGEVGREGYFGGVGGAVADGQDGEAVRG
ncbi:hypothetical protein [Actinacidiphila soli]|nr:hypothetical protein [Actinacidiphila soli]